MKTKIELTADNLAEARFLQAWKSELAKARTPAPLARRIAVVRQHLQASQGAITPEVAHLLRRFPGWLKYLQERRALWESERPKIEAERVRRAEAEKRRAEGEKRAQEEAVWIERAEQAVDHQASGTGPSGEVS